MSYFVLEPEVAGGFGDGTVMDTSVEPPRVERLHYEIFGWLGDELLESTPCFVVAKTLAERLTAAGVTGFRLADVEVTADEQDEELMGESAPLPEFWWLQVTGQRGVDDFGLTDNASLVVSERALAVLRTGTLDNCDIEPF